MADQKKYVNILSKKAISDNVEPQQIITSLNIVPNKEGQTITASGIVAGYSPINVAGVNASIDENIQPENIRAGITILGVDGELAIPEYYREFTISDYPRGTLQRAKTDKIINLTGVDTLGTGSLCLAYYNNPNLRGTLDLSGIRKISGQYSCYEAFYNCGNITKVDLSSLEETDSINDSCYGMFANCSGLQEVDVSSLRYLGGTQEMFANCENLETIDLSSVTRIEGYQACRKMFVNCSKLKSVDLSNAVIGRSASSKCDNMFYYCTSLETADLSGTTYVSQYDLNCCFEGCSALRSLDLSSLESVNSSGLNRCCYMCSSLTSVDLSSLNEVAGSALSYAFAYCTSLTTLSFPALTSNSFGSYNNQFSHMLDGVTGCTVHFPSNLQSVIGSWTDVVNGFGGTNTTVLFDLSETE